jgi:hypothetical protein
VDITTAKAQSQLAAMRAGKRFVRSDELVSGEERAPFVWRVLTRGEKQGCLARAHKRFAAELELPAALRNYMDLEDELVVQCLALAMRDPEDHGRPFAKSPEEMRDLLTVDELNDLWNRYGDFEDEVNPDLDGSEVWPAIEQALKKKDLRALMSCGCVGLASYMLTMAHPQSSSPSRK